ncbi:hypothetical protein II906_11410 [bacterium]|nr:hypothetical protein [bacterium]
MTVGLFPTAINYDTSTNGMGFGLPGYSNCSGLFSIDAINQLHDYNQTKKGINIQDGTTTAYLQQSLDSIRSYIEDGHEDTALEAYQELMETMSENTLYASLSDADKQTYIRQVFQEQNGYSLEDCINDNASDRAGTTYKKILFWGNADSTSKEDLLESMCNIKSEKTYSNVIVDVLAAVVSPFTAIGNALFGNKKQ